MRYTQEVYPRPNIIHLPRIWVKCTGVWGKSTANEKDDVHKDNENNDNGDKNCWFVHEDEPEPVDTYKCNLCESEFNSPPEFLRHRKKYHEQIVPICKKFESGECIFGSEKCWFNHKSDSEDANDKKIKDGKLENVKV